MEPENDKIKECIIKKIEDIRSLLDEIKGKVGTKYTLPGYKDTARKLYEDCGDLEINISKTNNTKLKDKTKELVNLVGQLYNGNWITGNVYKKLINESFIMF